MARCGCVNTCSCLVQALDTDCIDMNVGGAGTLANPYVISATPVIDPDPNNTLTCGAAGLMAQGANVVALDTDSIDMTVTEAPNNTFTVSGVVLLQDDGTGPLAGTPGDPPGENLLKLNPGQGINGLYVSCEDIQDCVGQAVQVLAGDCLEYDDANNSLNVEVDPDVTNILTCGGGPSGTGLYVPPSPTVVNVVDNAQNIDAVVGPPDTITFTCVPVPVVSSDPLCLVITGDTCTGLNIDLNPGPIVNNDPTCLTLTGDICNGLVTDLIISPDACNGIECRGNGLFVFRSQEPDIAAQGAGQCGNAGPLNGSGVVRIVPEQCLTITNPSDCRSMSVYVSFELSSVDVSANSGSITGNLLEGNGTAGPVGGNSTFAFGTIDAPGLIRIHGSGGNRSGIPNGAAVTIPPGGTYTHCFAVEARFGAQAGAGVGAGGAPVVNGNVIACGTMNIFGHYYF